MRIVVRTVLYASGGSPIASTTSATLDSSRSQRTCMRRYSASVRVGDFLRGIRRRYHASGPLSTKVLRNYPKKDGGRLRDHRHFPPRNELLLGRDDRVAFARTDLLGGNDLLGRRAVGVRARFGRVLSAYRRADREVLALHLAFALRPDHAGIGLLDGLMIALAEVCAALLRCVVVVVLERLDEFLGVGRPRCVEAVDDVAARHVAQILAPVDCRDTGLEHLVDARRVAARFRTPDVSPDRADEVVDRHPDRDVVAAQNSAELHLLVEAELHGVLGGVLAIRTVVGED